jgi:hypothetical protein
MSVGNITIYDENAFGYPGDMEFAVASGTTASISPGEPVSKPLGAAAVALAGTNTPVVATDFYAGIASSYSTETASAAGTVKVTKLMPGMTYLIAPNAPTSWDTQAEYDALVGDRVLLDLTATVWTILATDGATYGCVIEPLDIKKYPGKVRFSFRNGVSYLT